MKSHNNISLITCLKKAKKLIIFLLYFSTFIFSSSNLVQEKDYRAIKRKITDSSDANQPLNTNFFSELDSQNDSQKNNLIDPAQSECNSNSLAVPSSSYQDQLKNEYNDIFILDSETIYENQIKEIHHDLQKNNQIVSNPQIEPDSASSIVPPFYQRNAFLREFEDNPELAQEKIFQNQAKNIQPDSHEHNQIASFSQNEFYFLNAFSSFTHTNEFIRQERDMFLLPPETKFQNQSQEFQPDSHENNQIGSNSQNKCDVSDVAESLNGDEFSIRGDEMIRRNSEENCENQPKIFDELKETFNKFKEKFYRNLLSKKEIDEYIDLFEEHKSDFLERLNDFERDQLKILIDEIKNNDNYEKMKNIEVIHDENQESSIYNQLPAGYSQIMMSDYDFLYQKISELNDLISNYKNCSKSLTCKRRLNTFYIKTRVNYSAAILSIKKLIEEIVNTSREMGVSLFTLDHVLLLKMFEESSHFLIDDIILKRELMEIIRIKKEEKSKGISKRKIKYQEKTKNNESSSVILLRLLDFFHRKDIYYRTKNLYSYRVGWNSMNDRRNYSKEYKEEIKKELNQNGNKQNLRVFVIAQEIEVLTLQIPSIYSKIKGFLAELKDSFLKEVINKNIKDQTNNILRNLEEIKKIWEESEPEIRKAYKYKNNYTRTIEKVSSDLNKLVLSLKTGDKINFFDDETNYKSLSFLEDITNTEYCSRDCTRKFIDRIFEYFMKHFKMNMEKNKHLMNNIRVFYIPSKKKSDMIQNKKIKGMNYQ